MFRRITSDVRDVVASSPRVDAVATVLRGRAAVCRVGHRLPATHGHRPFFIIGSGRSGTTLIRRILLTSPSVHIPPETHVIGEVVGSYRRYAYLPWRELVGLSLAKLQFHPEFQAFEMDLGPVYRRLKRLPKDQRCLAAIFCEVAREHAAAVGRPDAHLFGEKTPNTTEEAFRVKRMFPNARFVHALRDGRDVVSSFAAAGIFPLEKAAEVWVRRTKISRRLAARYPDSCHTVRYEDLVTDPLPVTKTLAEFLAIDPATINIDETGHVSAMGDVSRRDFHARVRQPIGAQRIGRWRDTLTPEQMRQVGRILGRELQRWGYDD